MEGSFQKVHHFLQREVAIVIPLRVQSSYALASAEGSDGPEGWMISPLFPNLIPGGGGMFFGSGGQGFLMASWSLTTQPSGPLMQPVSMQHGSKVSYI